MRFQPEGDYLRIICNMASLESHPFLCLVEWPNLRIIISIVQSVAGPSWRPRELSFISRWRVPDVVREAFPDTQFRMGQPHTSVLVDRADLALLTQGAPLLANSTSSLLASWEDQADPHQAWEFVSLLRSLIQPYLYGGRPDVALVAEVAGVSRRTLQRRLASCGSSFSQIVQEASFELACRYLGDADLKVIEVAMMVGYETPQHFTRAFRRFTGITPSQFRQHGLGGNIAPVLGHPTPGTSASVALQAV